MNSVEESHDAKIAILGRPNVGKSTLLNYLAKEKYSITANRAQTTRCQVAASGSIGKYKVLWLDTPGINFRHKHMLHRLMHRNAIGTIGQADITILMLEALRWLGEDQQILQQLQDSHSNMLIAINKCDRIRDKGKLLPYVAELGKIQGLQDSTPLFISARSGNGMPQLTAAIEKAIEAMPPRDNSDDINLEPAVALNDSGMEKRKWHFLAAELMREKLTRRLADELPHQLFVKTEDMRSIDNITHFEFTIVVANKGQKGIVIGAGGNILKQVGTEVRQELEKRLNGKVNITSRVRQQANWFNDQEQLGSATSI